MLALILGLTGIFQYEYGWILDLLKILVNFDSDVDDLQILCGQAIDDFTKNPDNLLFKIFAFSDWSFLWWLIPIDPLVKSPTVAADYPNRISPVIMLW